MNHPMPFPPVIDSSMRSAFVACPESWRRRYLEGLTRPGTNIHLHFGGAFAKAMEAFRNHFYDPLREMPPTIEEALGVAFSAAIKFWGDHDPSGNGTNKSLERLMGAIEAFVHHHNPTMDWVRPAIDGAGKLCTEFSGAIPLPINNPSTGKPLLYSGKFDQIVQTSSGALMGEDDKTTTQLGDLWTRQWRLRGQFTGYIWLAREFGYNLEGFVVRGISILKRDYGFAEVIEQRTPAMIGRWYDQLLRDVRRMIECWQSNIWDQAFDSACGSYGGCQFQDLCASDTPERWVSQFEYRPFDPLGKGDD